MRIGGYEVIELLGDGGMGSVYRCRDPRFDRQVAVKVLHPHYQRSRDVVWRFKAEAVVQAKLAHPNIVTVFDFLTEEPNLAIVMELVEGESAERLVETGGPLAVDRGLELFHQVLAAIGYAHSQGLVHRDVKPSNILIQRTAGLEIAKVVDFGIAKIAGSDRQRTATSAKLGTLAYMSPEQLRNAREADRRSDVYSLGVTLQQLLTGCLPFDSENDYDVMRAILEGQPAPPLLDGRPLPERVTRAIRKALMRDPDQRFQSCEEFGSALRGEIELPPAFPAIARESPAPAPAPGRESQPHAPAGGSKPVQRPWLRRAATLVGLVLVLAGGSGGWLALRAAREGAARSVQESQRLQEDAAQEAQRLRSETEAREAEARNSRLREQREREQRESEQRRDDERQQAQRELERQRLESADHELDEAIRRATAEMHHGDLEAARQRLKSARDAVPRDLRADLDDPLETARERLLEIERRLLERQAADRTEEAMAAARRKVFEDQLALARAHLAASRFPEARSVVQQLLVQPDLPADLRIVGEELVAEARRGLEAGWGDAAVGGAVQTKRRPDSRNP